jgi:hypothetical protein
MTASLGQPLKLQITTGRQSIGFVSKIISGDTVNVVVFTDAVQPWPTIDTPNGLVGAYYNSVAKGTSVGQWQELDLPASVTDAIAAAVATAIAGLASDADITAALATVASNLSAALSTVAGNLASAVTAFEAEIAAAVSGALSELPEDDDSGLTVVAPAGTSHAGLGLNAARQPSSSRPTRVTASGSMSLTSTLLGAQTASVQFLSDASNPPTTSRGTAPAALSGVAATIGVPWCLIYDVPAGHYYKLVTAASANASVSLSEINETAG